MDSDEEQNVGEDELEDAEWRKQRYEREKFLQEQQAKVIRAVIDFLFMKVKLHQLKQNKCMMFSNLLRVFCQTWY